MGLTGWIESVLVRTGIMANAADSARFSRVDDELNGFGHAPAQDPEDETACEVCGADVDVILVEGQRTVIHAGMED